MDLKSPEPVRQRRKKMLTPGDWIDAAMELLVDKSIDAVRVEVLARGFDITIGSFYYHFKNRDDLLTQLLKHWHESTTAQVVRVFGVQDLTTEEALAKLLELPFHGLTARRAAMIEFAIRGWARRDAMARDAVRGVDEQRLAYYTEGFRAAGFGKAEAANRAFTFYSFQLSQSLLWELNDDKARKRQLKFTKELLFVRLPSK